MNISYKDIKNINETANFIVTEDDLEDLIY